MKVEWSEPALDDLQAIQLYIAHDSASYARRFVERAFAATDRLSAFPHMGRAVPEAGSPDIRELIYNEYRLIYQIVLPERVVVIAVVHGRRDLTRKELQPWNVD